MLPAVAVTPMRKLAALCEFFGVRVALHGPGDCSPVGMMANLAIDLSISNLGIQELDYVSFREKTGANEVFPGFELIGPRDGMLWPNNLPGLGIGIDEAAAARYPWPAGFQGVGGKMLRRRDGSIVPP